MSYMKEAAQRRGLSTYAIAEKTGIDRGQISRYLNGHKSPTLTSFFKLADVLGIAVKFESQGIQLIPLTILPQSWELNFPENEEE